MIQGIDKEKKAIIQLMLNNIEFTGHQPKGNRLPGKPPHGGSSVSPPQENSIHELEDRVEKLECLTKSLSLNNKEIKDRNGTILCVGDILISPFSYIKYTVYKDCIQDDKDGTSFALVKAEAFILWERKSEASKLVLWKKAEK